MDEFSNFTEAQVDEIESRLHILLGDIFRDNYDRETVIESILPTIIEDIDECADWSDLEDDEVCYDDIDIALARTIYAKFVNNA